MGRLVTGLCVLAGLGLGAGLWLTRATAPDVTIAAALAGNAEQGRAVFWAGGCASCHAAPGAESVDGPALSGGYRLESPFGTFVAPNISPDPTEGIGAWTQADFVTAMRAGVSPAGGHYFPAFPYSAYTRMTNADVADLWAFLQTLPADATPNQPHELAFPFSIRRGVGLWKLLYLTEKWALPAETEALERGRYLVEAVAHCAECHTPRDALGGLDRSRWMAGAPNPSGKGKIPNITPAALDWDEEDVADYLKTGFTPDFDSVGGSMAKVVTGLGKLPDADIAAIAAYVATLPPAE